MTHQMPDGELDAILNAVNTEIQNVLEQAVDLAAGHEQVVQQSGENSHSNPAATLPEASWRWPGSANTCMELTRGESDNIPAPYLDWHLALSSCTYERKLRLRVHEVLSQLEAMRHTLLLWNKVEGCARPRQAPTWDSARVIMILDRVECGLLYRSLPRQDALNLIDQLDHEVRPWAFILWESAITGDGPCRWSNKRTEVDQTVDHEPPDQDPPLLAIPETLDGVADPYTVITQLDQLRQDIDQLFDDNDNLVTC